MEILESKYYQKSLSENKSDKIYPRNLNISTDLCNMLGLSQNQFKIFRCLSMEGPKPASQLSMNLDIPRTEIYPLLKILQKKNCVIPKNDRPLKFEAFPIQEILNKKIDFERKKLQELEEILMFFKSKNEKGAEKLLPPLKME